MSNHLLRMADVTTEASLWSRLSTRLHSDLVRRAYELARAVHAGQTRDEGSPYIEHPLRVALILIEECNITTEHVIAAALLHDTLEDKEKRSLAAADRSIELSRQSLERDFGSQVATMVSLLTKEPEGKAQRDQAYYAAIAAADPDTRRLKCADRLDNLRRLHLSPQAGKAERYKHETRAYVLPIARETDEYLYEQILSFLT